MVAWVRQQRVGPPGAACTPFPPNTTSPCRRACMVCHGQSQVMYSDTERFVLMLRALTEYTTFCMNMLDCQVRKAGSKRACIMTRV